MAYIENVSLSPVKTAIKKITTTVKKRSPKNTENKPPNSGNNGNFSHSGEVPKPATERLDSAIMKFNAANEIKLVAETNFFAELDNDYKLLQEYGAYKNPGFKNSEFVPVCEDTVFATCKGKSAEIKLQLQDDGNKLYEIKFNDDSIINYTVFSNGGKMNINGEEFEMPVGTVVETKSVKGRIFSQLIQTPQMLRKVVNIPDDLDKVEKLLKSFNSQKSFSETQLPKPGYILDLLGKSNSVRSLLNLSKYSSYDSSKILSDEATFFEKSIKDGKLPINAVISGINKDGRRIITIPKDNCRYELCGSEMRVIDNKGEIRMVARYEAGRENHGLWVVTYDCGKPAKVSHYASWDLEKPLSTVNYDYSKDNKAVTAITIDSFGNKNRENQALSGDFCLSLNNGLKFVSADKSHLGSQFEN